MKNPTLKEMLAVPAEFRSMNDEELSARIKTQWTTPSNRGDIAVVERHRRNIVALLKARVRHQLPSEIAEHKKSIALIEKEIEDAEKRVAKLEAQP